MPFLRYNDTQVTRFHPARSFESRGLTITELFFIPRLAVFFLDLLTFMHIPSDSSFNRRVPPFLFLLTPSVFRPPVSTFLFVWKASLSFFFSFTFHPSSVCRCCLPVLSLHLSLSLAVSFLPLALPVSFPGDSFSLSFIFLYLLVIVFLGACPAFSLVQFSSLSRQSSPPYCCHQASPPYCPAVHLPLTFLPHLLIIASLFPCPSVSFISHPFLPPPMQW